MLGTNSSVPIDDIQPSSSSDGCGVLGTSSADTNQSPNSAQMISNNQILQLNMNPSTALSTVTMQHSYFASPTQVVSPSNTQPIIDNAGPFQLKFLTALLS